MITKKIKLIIILLLILGVVVFGYLYFLKPTTYKGAPSTDTNFLSQLFPFGKSKTQKDVKDAPVDVSGYVPPDTAQTFISKLRKVSSMPIAGYTVFAKEIFKDVPMPLSLPTPEQGGGENSNPITTTPEPEKVLRDKKGKIIKTIIPKPTPPPTEFVTTLRYVDKATGNIYQALAGKIEERKFTTTVVPKVHEAYFGNKGEGVVMRFLKNDDRTIESFTGALPKEMLGGDAMGETELKGTFLPENITDMSVSSDSFNIFYIFNIGNSSAGVTAETLGEKKNQVFDSPFTEWLTQWPNSKMITITTKPGSGEPGYMYSINPDKKDLLKVLGGINGLTTLTSPDGKIVLYGNDTLSLFLYNIKTGEHTPFGVKTMPEKCTWTNGSDTLYCAVPKFINQNNYPDSWYMGETSFSDEIWRIDAVNGNPTQLLDPMTINGGEESDMIKLMLDENENYLFFVNKKDGFLWEFNLK